MIRGNKIIKKEGEEAEVRKQRKKKTERLRQRKPSKMGEGAKVSTSRGRLEGRSQAL